MITFNSFLKNSFQKSMGQEEEKEQHLFSKAAEPAQGKKLQEISGAGEPSWKLFPLFPEFMQFV